MVQVRRQSDSAFVLALSPTVLEQHCHRAHVKREQGQSRRADLPRGIAEQGHMVQVRRLVCKKTRRCRQAVVLIKMSPINATHCGSMSSYLQANEGAGKKHLHWRTCDKADLKCRKCRE